MDGMQSSVAGPYSGGGGAIARIWKKGKKRGKFEKMWQIFKVFGLFITLVRLVLTPPLPTRLLNTPLIGRYSLTDLMSGCCCCWGVLWWCSSCWGPLGRCWPKPYNITLSVFFNYSERSKLCPTSVFLTIWPPTPNKKKTMSAPAYNCTCMAGRQRKGGVHWSWWYQIVATASCQTIALWNVASVSFELEKALDVE